MDRRYESWEAVMRAANRLLHPLGTCRECARMETGTVEVAGEVVDVGRCGKWGFFAAGEDLERVEGCFEHPCWR